MSVSRTTAAGATHRLRHIATAALAVVAVGSLAACSSGGSGSSSSSSLSGKRAQTLIVAENEVPASFDPVQADNSTVDEVVLPTYDTLVSYKGNTVTGDLAKSWKVSSDGTSIDVTLKGTATFHDGSKLTATDVAYTLDRDKTIGTGVAALLTAYSSTTVDSPTELTIHLSTPDATFVPALSRAYIVEKKLVEQHLGSDHGQGWLADHDAGSGAYELDKYTANQSATFSRYGDYWKQSSGRAKNVEFQYFSSSASESQALKAGDVDIAMDIAPTEWASYKKASGYKVNEAATNVGLYAYFNMGGDKTKSKALREAVALSYDYKQHVSSILKGAGAQLDGILPKSLGISSDGVTQPKYDLAKARKIVKDNGLKGTTLTMTYFKATTEMEQSATLLQASLAKLGITLKTSAVTYPTYVTMASKASTRPDIAEVYAFPTYPDASAVLYQNFDSKFIGSGENWGAYSNPQVDSLLASAQTSTDTSTRKADYLKAEKLITADYATINMANSKYVTVMSNRVQNYTYQASHHQTVDVDKITISK